jgi:ferredoxin
LPVVSVVVRDSRRKRTLQAAEGSTLLGVLKSAGVPLPAICGGKGACGTCKIALGGAWADTLPPPQKREQRLLAHLQAVTGERLSCQITLTADLNGIEVRANPHPKEHESWNRPKS